MNFKKQTYEALMPQVLEGHYPLVNLHMGLGWVRDGKKKESELAWTKRRRSHVARPVEREIASHLRSCLEIELWRVGFVERVGEFCGHSVVGRWASGTCVAYVPAYLLHLPGRPPTQDSFLLSFQDPEPLTRIAVQQFELEQHTCLDGRGRTRGWTRLRTKKRIK